jgi:hypothetical protein
MILSIACHQCQKLVSIEVHKDDVDRWFEGELVQAAFPYLSASDREMLISRTCPDCWNKMFDEGEDDEDATNDKE